jgi:dolichol-phosphate mannosyltransferase
MTETRTEAPRRRALVCLPTYDEKDNVGPITEAILAATPEVDVLVIDDNSPDGTGQLADAIAAREPRVKVLHRAGKEGLGKAYLAGFDWALRQGYELVLEMDADFSHDPRYLPGMLAASREADLVLGSRNIEGGGTVNWGILRKIISRGGSLYARTSPAASSASTGRSSSRSTSPPWSAPGTPSRSSSPTGPSGAASG